MESGSQTVSIMTRPWGYTMRMASSVQKQKEDKWSKPHKAGREPHQNLIVLNVGAWSSFFTSASFGYFHSYLWGVSEIGTKIEFSVSDRYRVGWFEGSYEILAKCDALVVILHGSFLPSFFSPWKKQADNDPQRLKSQLPICYFQWQDIAAFSRFHTPPNIMDVSCA